MKIWYIGKFSPRFRTECYVQHAFQQLGHKVVRRGFRSSLTLQELEDQCQEVAPDLVLFSKASVPCFTEFLQWCRAAELPTVCWLWDLYFGFRKSRPPQFKCDYVFTTDGGHKQRWQALGVNHHVVRQGIHEPEHRYYTDPQIRHDVAFVGSTAWPARVRLVARLRQEYGKRMVHHTRTRGLRLNQALARVKVVVGDSYPSPNYWSNRIYEILGRGGFLLHPETPGLEAEFTDGEHYVSYPREDRGRLRELVNYYIHHDEEREQIRRAGFERMAELTYTHRVQELLNHISAIQQG